MAKKPEKDRGRRGGAKKGAGRAEARPAGGSSATAARGDRALRRHLGDLLRGGNAHAVFDQAVGGDRKSTRLNSSHSQISYAVFCLKKKKKEKRKEWNS